MAPPHLFFGPLVFGTELAFTVIAVAFCFLIYFKTRESYELTRYVGIRYFRDAFLFFGLSYALRFLFGMGFAFGLPHAMLVLLLILLLGYFSTIGIFYLIFSAVWKRYRNDMDLLVTGHGVALLMSGISFITRSPLILLYLQYSLLVVAVTLGIFLPGKTGSVLSQTKILYLLVALLWLLNLPGAGPRRPFPPEMEIFFQAISLIVFVVIYSKVSKWIK